MKRLFLVVLAFVIVLNSGMVVKADNEIIPIEVPTGEEWENIPELHEWPDPNGSMARWNYTGTAYLYFTFTANHANVTLDVMGYSSATCIQAVLVYEKYVNGRYVEVQRQSYTKNNRYLVATMNNPAPAATYGQTYRVTAIIRVYAGSDYEDITLRSTKTYNAANTASIEDAEK